MGNTSENYSDSEPNYQEINRALWNEKTSVHVNSEFYDMSGFRSGKTSLKHIELDGVGEVRGKSLLHLQCHFGQDTLSWAREGAEVTGVDLSDESIKVAQNLTEELGLAARFVVCDLYDLPDHLDAQDQFDIVFTSYGTIGWLPDLDRWASVIQQYLKPGGTFYMVEFHPVIWMYDDDFREVAYSYFNRGPLTLATDGTYADRTAELETSHEVSWNHHLGEVLGALLKAGLSIDDFREYNYSTWDCFPEMTKIGDEKWVITPLGEKFPHMYAIRCNKSL